jgi:hypothetical protein
VRLIDSNTDDLQVQIFGKHAKTKSPKTAAENENDNENLMPG